ncbi:amidohydrolase family protein [Desulfatitalea alkaliphila]|uniref:Amidohydrolase family protein n=1 Tax=Desulfatitalea alkaliphila TaxID=2929485 RepID=A0AA41R643_9BACT|nr:amidohydrolase family protein [Desulfatitalea alkaliphila]MCJ8503064.1 amidohydrolase family protein [Desulfatitalea alkaliphila]
MSGAPDNSPPAARWLRIGRLIDGRGGPPRQNVVMEIRDGRITALQPDHPPAAEVRDLSRATVLPALMDAHVHLAFSGSEDPEIRAAQLQASPDQVVATAQHHLGAHRKWGISAVRDGGDRSAAILHSKMDGRLATEPSVTVLTPGWAWHAAGRYGAMIGRHPAPGQSLAEAITPHLATIDHLKILQSGINSLKRCGPVGGPQFSASDLQMAVRTAHAAGKPVMVHANGDLPVRLALEAGCDSIEHGYFMGPDNLRRMADRSVTWVPTAVPMAALARAEGLTQEQRDVARRTLDHQLDQIRQAHDLGVFIALGTDAGSHGVHHGQAVREELLLLMDAGLSLPAAIRCATRNAARLMGLQNRGSLVSGRRADFIVLPGPPERLLENLNGIFDIHLNGQPCQPV